MSFLIISDAQVGEVKEKTHRLTVEVSIVGDATPADKGLSNDLGGALIIRAEGQTAVAEALEAGLSWTTAVDDSTGDSQFGLLLDGSKLCNNAVLKVLSVSVSDSLGTATSVASSKVEAEFLTAGGNVAIDIAGTGLDLSAENAVILLDIVYREE